MNVAMYLYDGYYETEIALAGLVFRRERLFTVAGRAGSAAAVDGRRRLLHRSTGGGHAQVLPAGIPTPA